MSWRARLFHARQKRLLLPEGALPLNWETIATQRGVFSRSAMLMGAGEGTAEQTAGHTLATTSRISDFGFHFLTSTA